MIWTSVNRTRLFLKLYISSAQKDFLRFVKEVLSERGCAGEGNIIQGGRPFVLKKKKEKDLPESFSSHE